MHTGWSWGALLIVYFVSAALLSHHQASAKSARLGGLMAKEGPRDALQVAANGGAFAAAAVAHYANPDPLWQAVAAGALSASAADTWATELGVLSTSAPRSILSWSPVAPGTSGGVTVLGLLAGIAGAAFMTVVVWSLGWPPVAALSALAGGTLGCVLDSIVGASLQAQRWCVSCAMATEQRVHRCGTQTQVTRGLSWLDNDGVNAIATIGGALFGGVLASYF
jgi:uncharacterized protein (TIGR00297 family)